MFIYLDESGTLTESNGKYFVVATYTVGDSRKITKSFRKWQKIKFPRKLRSQAELKFNDSHISDKLRLKTLKHFAKQDIRIFYTFLKKKNIPQEYCKKGRVAKTGLLYSEIVKASLLPKLPAKILFQVQAVDSSTNPLIQVADWVCGALARYHEAKSGGEEFYTVLKGNIVQEKELFSEKWTRTWEK